MRRDSPLAMKEVIRKEDLLNVPLICSRQAISGERRGNEFAEWFGEDFDKLDIVATFNLVYNCLLYTSTLTARNPTGQIIELRHFCNGGIDHPQFGATHRRGRIFQLHDSGRAAINKGRALDGGLM